MLKAILCLSVCLCGIGGQVFAELTPQDLDKIRLIIHEANQPIKTEIATIKTEIATIKTEIATIKTEIKTVKDEIKTVKDEIKTVKDEIVKVTNEVSWIRGRLETIDKYLAWLTALIVVAIGIPQIVVAWRSRKDREQEKQIEVLRQEIEALKQQGVASR